MVDHKAARVLEEWLIIAIFAIAISLPAILTKYQTESVASFDENRRLAGFPQLSLNLRSLASLPRGFGLYFNDHFAFRKTMVRAQAVVRVKWLGDSTSPNVIVGANGWLFNRTHFGIRAHNEPLTPEQVDRWRQALIDRSSWLAGRGIKYFFVVAPAKQEVYPEYLPAIVVTGPSRQDQIIAALRGSNVEIIDLRPALREAKRAQLVYLKTDSHWTTFGGFIGYQSIIKQVSKSSPILDPLSESVLQFSPPVTFSGDLSRLLGLYNSFTEHVVVASAVVPLPPLEGDFTNPAVNAKTRQQGASLPRLMMFRDSFSTAMIPPLSHHFSYAIFVWQQALDRELIRSERPDLVIQEVYEGLISDDPPADVPLIADRKTPEAGSGGKFDGAHTLINCYGTMGWAWDRSRPDEAIMLDAFMDDRPLATIVAGTYQQDLLDRGIGNGRHAFSYPFPPELRNSKVHQIRFRVTGTNVDLPGTPLPIKCDPF